MVGRYSALAVAALLAAGSASAAIIERIEVPGSRITEIRIADPRTYWRDAGFRQLAPGIRVSVAAHTGARTRIYLKVGDGRAIHTGSSGEALVYPPGSEADRVSLVRFRDESGIGYTIDDVRGTRWDANGREYFHVYRASGPEPHAPLIGYEWPRDDPRAAREATTRLAAVVRDTLLPNGYRSSRWDVRRFVRLNRCQSCHISNKPAAQTVFDRGPPWATDAHGLYTPLAVLYSRSPVSADSSFHDPNAGDPHVTVSCRAGEAAQHGSPGGYYFSCSDQSYPQGERTLSSADPYASEVCASRRYLHALLDTAGQRRFDSAVDACQGLK